MPENYRQTLVDRTFYAAGLQRHRAVSFHSYFQVPAVFCSSDHVCTLPTRLGEHFASLHNLEMLALPFDVDMPLYLNWSKAQDLNPGHRWLRRQVARLGKRLLNPKDS